MKLKNRFRPIILLVFISLYMFSCSDDNNGENQDPQPTELDADNRWFEDKLEDDNESWYKIVGDETFTTLYLEWAESGAQGEDRDYTADIAVSAYKLDGITPYFEDKNNGYGESKKSISIDDETSVLVKVTLNDASMPGTYAIRSTGTSDIQLDYTDLAIGDTWAEGTIEAGETIGYKVKFSGVKKYQIIWAEEDSPESGYTANILGTVLQNDGTIYKDVVKGKDFLNKNKSHSDDPKVIETNGDDKNFKIHLTNTKEGNYAIKVVEIVE